MVEVLWRLYLWNGKSYLSTHHRNIIIVASWTYVCWIDTVRLIWSHWQDYWFQGSQDIIGDKRFITTPDAFCIISFSRPTNGQLVVHKRLPIFPGDQIVLLSPSTARQNSDRPRSDGATGLPWSVDPTGQLIVNISESDLDGVEYAWAFQVRYALPG